MLIREGGLLDAEGPGGGREPSFQGPAFCPLALPELPQFLPLPGLREHREGTVPFFFQSSFSSEWGGGRPGVRGLSHRRGGTLGRTPGV